LAGALHAISTDSSFAEVEDLFSSLEAAALARMFDDGFASDEVALERSVDARYPGQVHELTVPVPAGEVLNEAEIASIRSAFNDEHERQFTYARPELAIEFLHWRVTAVGRLPIASPERGSESPGDAADALIAERDVYFEDAEGLTKTPVFKAELLRPGARIEGPAIVQAATTTIVVNPGDALSVNPDLGFAIEIGLG